MPRQCPKCKSNLLVRENRSTVFVLDKKTGEIKKKIPKYRCINCDGEFVYLQDLEEE